MKKGFSLLIFLLIGFSVYATETRVNGLGNIVNYVDDDLNIGNFPGSLSRYRNLSVLEMGDKFEAGSATLIYYNKDLNLDFALLLGKEIDTPSILSPSYNPEVQTKVMLGRDNKVFYLGFAGDTYEYREDGIAKQEINFYDFSLGYGYSSPGDSPFEMGLHVSYNIEKSVSGHISSNDGYENNKETVNATDVDLFLRSKHTLINGYLRPFLNLNFYYGDSQHRIETQITTERNNIDYYKYYAELGFAYETNVFEHSTLWAGIVPFAFSYSSKEADLKDLTGKTYCDDKLARENNAYLFVSLESHIKPWLTTRIALKSEYTYTFDNRPDANEQSDTLDIEDFSNTTSVFYGLAFHYSKFTLDMTVNPDMFYNGSYFISGNSTNFLVGYISLSYKW